MTEIVLDFDTFIDRRLSLFEYILFFIKSSNEELNNMKQIEKTVIIRLKKLNAKKKLKKYFKKKLFHFVVSVIDTTDLSLP